MFCQPQSPIANTNVHMEMKQNRKLLSVYMHRAFVLFLFCLDLGAFRLVLRLSYDRNELFCIRMAK